MFVQHQIGLLAFLAALLIVALSNVRFLRRLQPITRPQRYPRVSVLVPARNEKENIGPCVVSLLNQRYPDFHVVALNDGSSDGTGEALATIAAGQDQLLVVDGEPLPTGWLGKNWACHQLARLADGELLLFVDADTRHHPDTVRAAVATLESEQADGLSAIPREEVVTWAERLVVPIIPWSIFLFLPVFLADRVRSPWLSAAIGQFMLLRRTAYEHVGGHSSVRASVVDDLTLARRVKSAGLRWRIVDGSSLVSCRMYRNRSEVVQGISRTLFAVFDNRIAVHVFVWMWLTVVFVEPPVVLGLALARLPVLPTSVWLAGAAVLTSIILWLLAYSRLRIPSYLTLLYPATISIVSALAVRSAIVTLAGRVTWRGRHIGPTTQP